MFKIKIIAVGKLTEDYCRKAADDYLSRANRFYSAAISEPKPEPLPQNPGENEIKAALDKEAERIKAIIPPRAVVVAMCVEGKQMPSEDFSRMIEGWAAGGRSEACFIIGSSHGLSEEIKALADVKLSVSKMTFPHELFRVMLLEQIYRAGEISRGGKYHK